MTRTPIALLAASALCLPVACSMPAPVVGPAEPPPSDGLNEYHVEIPIEALEDVMFSKLAHAHALLEGIATEDFRQIETNAQILYRLSEEAGWRVHTTVAYGLFSDEFGETMQLMGRHARNENISGVTNAYTRMTQDCVRCHTYMRTEGLLRDTPGTVSWATTPDAP